MPTFHPAFLLRSPERKKDVWEDMKLVRDYLAGSEALSVERERPRTKDARPRLPHETLTLSLNAEPVSYCTTVLKIGKWLAAPMKKSIGTESHVFVRDARNARRAQSGCSAGAGAPVSAVARSSPR